MRFLSFSITIALISLSTITTSCTQASRNKTYQLVPVFEREILPEFLGYNTGRERWRGADPWNNDKLLQATVDLKPGTIRYPGGTYSNYWDWQRGTVDAKLDTSQFQLPWWFNSSTNQSYLLDDLEQVIRASPGTQAMFTLNVVTDNEGIKAGTPEYQLQMLQAWQEKGLPIKYVELGNEVSSKWEESLVASRANQKNGAGYTSKYQDVQTYASEMAAWISLLRQELGSSPQIGLVAGPSPIGERYKRHIEWNSSLDRNFNSLFGSGKANAIIFHFFFRTKNYPLDSTSTDTFIAKGIEAWRYSLNETIKADFKNPRFKEEVDIWVTEFNTDSNGDGDWGGTWAHALFMGAILNEQLSDPQITLVNYHDLLSKTFGAINEENLSYSNAGILLKNFGAAIQGMTKAEAFTIKKLPYSLSLKAGRVKYPGVYAWRFSNDNNSQAIISNMTSQEVNLNIEELGVNKRTSVMLFSNTPKTQALPQTTATPIRVDYLLTLPPFSFVLFL